MLFFLTGIFITEFLLQTSHQLSAEIAQGRMLLCGSYSRPCVFHFGFLAFLAVLDSVFAAWLFCNFLLANGLFCHLFLANRLFRRLLLATRFFLALKLV